MRGDMRVDFSGLAVQNLDAGSMLAQQEARMNAHKTCIIFSLSSSGFSLLLFLLFPFPSPFLRPEPLLALRYPSDQCVFLSKGHAFTSTRTEGERDTSAKITLHRYW